MKQTKIQSTPIDFQGFFKFGTELDLIDDLGEIYAISISKIYQDLQCDCVFIYLLSNEETFEKKFHTGNNSGSILRSSYGKNEGIVTMWANFQKLVFGVKSRKNTRKNSRVGEILACPLNNKTRTFGFVVTLNKKTSLNISKIKK